MKGYIYFIINKTLKKGVLEKPLIFPEEKKEHLSYLEEKKTPKPKITKFLG